MGVQSELLKTAAGISAAVGAIAGGDDEMKEAEKEAGSLAIRGSKPKTAPEAQKQPKKQRLSKVDEVNRASNSSRDALVAAQLQKTERRRASAERMNLVNSLRQMKKRELAKREEIK